MPWGAVMAEQEAREKIDNLLSLAGWSVQGFRKENLGESLGVDIKKFQLKTARVLDNRRRRNHTEIILNIID